MNITGSEFRSNTSGTVGGAVHIAQGGNMVVGVTVFAEKSAASAGGAVHCENHSSARFLDVTFFANAAPVGGGVFAGGTASVVLGHDIVAFSTRCSPM